jgi:hypothetical protein
MTQQRSFKRLVRLRMDKTGESYTTARRALLAGDEAGVPEAPALVAPDARIRERTGRGWEEWFELLDGWRAFELPHREIARRVAAELDVVPLAWAAQAVTSSYERAKGLRAVGEMADGFAASSSRTLAVPLERVVAAVTDDAERASWAPSPQLRERSRNGAKTIRFDVVDDPSRVTVHLGADGPAKTKVVVEQRRLADAEARERAKARWKAALDALKVRLEAEGLHPADTDEGGDPACWAHLHDDPERTGGY